MVYDARYMRYTRDCAICYASAGTKAGFLSLCSGFKLALCHTYSTPAHCKQSCLVPCCGFIMPECGVPFPWILDSCNYNVFFWGAVPSTVVACVAGVCLSLE